MNLPTRKIKFILLSQMIRVDFTNEAELNLLKNLPAVKVK